MGFLPELWDLFVEHREELTTNKALMCLAPDVERYRRLQEMGLLHSLIATRGEEIVGYSINVIDTSLHYKDVTFFTNDVLFLSEGNREGFAGIKLIRATESLARREGADMVMWHAKSGTNLAKILHRWGYAVQDIIYSKELI